jgi:hypothetical protein
MKKQARLQSEDVFKNPSDKVIDTLETISNTASSQGISTEVQPDKQKAPSDFTRKLTFQIRDSIYQRLKDRHYLLDKQLGTDAPDREVIVEEAIAALLDRMDNGEDLGEAIAHRQRIRSQDLEAGTLINPSSRKRK